MSDRSFVAPRHRLRAAAAILAGLTGLAVLGIADIQPPSPRPASAPADVFSAGRAFQHVERVGRETHVAGSPAADRVREYIVETLTGLGLRPQVQDATGLNASRLGQGGVARVRNIIATLPGQRSTGRLIILSHYDSAQVSQGANDDGAGVAAMLEVARIIAGGPPPRNDVVFLFTDAEETGLAGAEAFVNLHPLGRDSAVVLNLEARGSRGPVVMFQTSTGNARLIEAFAEVPHPLGTSVAVEVYRLLANDTDFTPFLAAGRFTGLNAAYLDGSYAYHSPLDRPATMDRASLQHHGDNTLALTRSLGGADLGPLMRPAAGDASYFPLAGFLVRYPGALVWPIAVLALVAVAGLAFLARRRGLTSWPRTATAFALAVLPLVGAAVAAQALWALLVALRPGYAVVLDPGRPGWFRLAVVALTASVLLCWYGLLRRRVGPAALAIGALGVLAVLGLLFAAAIPGGSYLGAVPALVGAAAGLGALYARPAPVRLALLGAGGGVSMLILAPTVSLFFPALGMRTGAAAAVFAVLTGLSLVPVLELLWRPVNRPGHRLLGATPAVAALAAGLLFAGTGLTVDRWDPDHPRPTHLMYALDHDRGTAQWVSLDRSRSAWTARYVPDRAALSAQFPILPAGELAVGPATAADLPAPEVTVLADTSAAGQRTVRLRLLPRRQVRLLACYGEVGDRRVVRATVAGREVAPYLDRLNRFGLHFHAVPVEGFEVTLVVTGTGPVRLRIIDGSDGLAELPGFQPRPPAVGVLGSHTSELLVVGRTVTL
ncbi:MAG TPA: M20/M25/M40 family metallo-hydrolase [Catenuloplanes sp.]